MVKRSARENIIAALFNEIPDYVPCCPDISNMIPARLTRKPFWDIYLHNDPPLGLAQVFAVDKLKVDGFSDQGILDPSPLYAKKKRERILPNQAKHNYIDTKTIFKTSHGDLTHQTRYYRNQPPTLIEKPIKDLTEDLPKLEEYFDPCAVQSFGAEYYSLVKEKLGDRGVICLNVPVPGLHWLHENQEGGFDTAVKLFYEKPELVKEACKVLHNYILEYARRGLRFDIDAIQLGASGLLHFQSPPIIRELSLPTMKEIALLAKSEGVPCHLHACGKEKALVKLAADDTVITSVEPLEMPPMGDCILSTIKQKFGERLGLKGNIHTIDVMLLGSPDDVENAVTSCINDAASDGGYILSTGDQCPAETPLENLITMVKTTRTYGQY
jgi:uroporphyrinogen decarboxylase